MVRAFDASEAISNLNYWNIDVDAKVDAVTKLQHAFEASVEVQYKQTSKLGWDSPYLTLSYQIPTGSLML